MFLYNFLRLHNFFKISSTFLFSIFFLYRYFQYTKISIRINIYRRYSHYYWPHAQMCKLGIKLPSSTDKSIMPSKSMFIHLLTTLSPFTSKLGVRVYEGAVLPQPQFTFLNSFFFIFFKLTKLEYLFFLNALWFSKFIMFLKIGDRVICLLAVSRPRALLILKKIF